MLFCTTFNSQIWIAVLCCSECNWIYIEKSTLDRTSEHPQFIKLFTLHQGPTQYDVICGFRFQSSLPSNDYSLEVFINICFKRDEASYILVFARILSIKFTRKYWTLTPSQKWLSSKTEYDNHSYYSSSDILLSGMMLSPYQCQVIPWESNKVPTGSDRIVSSIQPNLYDLKHLL